MNGLREKFRNKKGFTLVEMLIVVAIIAILIMVSIPMVNSALESAREAVDAANERNARAVATIAYMSATEKKPASFAEGGGIYKDGGSAYYVVGDSNGDTTTGTLSTTAPTGTQYGQGTKAGKLQLDHTGGYILVTVTAPAVGEANPTITVEWKGCTDSGVSNPASP